MRTANHQAVNRFNRLAQLLVFVLLSLSPSAQESREPGTINPQDLHAAFLTKFPHFVTWPEADERKKAPGIRLGVLGKSALNEQALNSITAQAIGGRPFIVTKLSSLSEIPDLDMLYIGSSETAEIEKIVAATAGKGILTIAAIPSFAHRGGMINFVTRNGKTRFEINLNKVQKEKIRISAKLLRAAIIIE